MKYRITSKHHFKPALLSLVTSLALLGGCSSDSDSDEEGDGFIPTATELAIVATTSADNTSGAHAVITTTEPFTIQQGLAGTVSDIDIAANGSEFYLLERTGSNSITRFNTTSVSTPITQFSVNDGEEGAANPYDLVFQSDNKAYLIRYGKTEAWVVNPLAENEDDFLIKKIDLSAYDPDDGSVDMAAGVIVDDKLFVIMQRFGSEGAQDAYIAVIDTSTDTEIDTNTNDDFKGILLPVKNPLGIQTDDNDEIYVVAAGKYWDYDSPKEYTGGIVTVDSDSYTTEVLLDDGDDDSHPYGSITNLEVVSTEQAYFVGYQDWEQTALYSFNPVTGVVNDTPLDGLAGINVSGLSTDSSNRLWVSIAAAGDRSAGIRVYNTDDNTLVGAEIPVEMNPQRIVFAEGVGN